MLILVLNSGSSSIKYKVFEITGTGERQLERGLVERIGEKIKDHKEGLNIILGKINKGIEAVGHRVVHGGVLSEAALINKSVIREIERASEMAPLHNPPALLTIKESLKLISSVPHVAVFDTAFYSGLPEHAFLYAVPYKYYKKYGIRKYGFHGTSHRYVAYETARRLKRPLSRLNLITCHLGNGCSVTAVKNGRAIDTSMGFTPLEGLIMGTRSGDIDPAIIPYIVEKEKVELRAVMDMLNKQSGLLGISGISNDMRELIKNAPAKKRARLAIEMFIHRLRKYIGAYSALLQRVDAVVFMGGIGENQPSLVKRATRGTLPSRTKILTIPTNEELMIARDVFRLVRSNMMYVR